MKNFITKLFCLAFALTVATTCFAIEPKDCRPNPDRFFDFIAKDLKLNDNQISQLEAIKTSLKNSDEKMCKAKLAEFQTLVDILEKNAFADEQINAFEKTSLNNEINFHFEKVSAMRDFYNLLDNNQKKEFADNMKPFKRGDNDKKAKNSKNQKRDKKDDNRKKQKSRKGSERDDRKAPPPMNDKNFEAGDRMGRPPMNDENFVAGDRMGPPPRNDRGFPDCQRMEQQQKGKNTRNDKNGKNAKSDKKGNDCPNLHSPDERRQIALHKEFMLNQRFARDLKLTKTQFESYNKIKAEIRAKREQAFDRDDFKKCGKYNDYITGSEDLAKVKEQITGDLNQLEDYNTFLLKKYFEFYGLLTNEQKNVVLLKYKYEIAKLSLPDNYDR